MAAPVISWYKTDNTTQVVTWDLGVVDAGTVSTDTTFLIWNNRSGSSSVSDMTNTTITTKDNSGGNTGELVTDKWIEAKLLGSPTYTPVGGTTTTPINGGNSAPAGTIKGSINDGNVATAATQTCFATVILHANVPSNATAGNIDFLTRVSYQYI